MNETSIPETCKGCECFSVEGCNLSIEESKCTPEIKRVLESIDADYRNRLSNVKDRENVIKLLEEKYGNIVKAIKDFTRRRSVYEEEIKVEIQKDALIIEGDMNIEFGVTGWNAELKMQGDISIDDVGDLIKWTKIKSETKGAEKRPRWKVTIERL